MQPLNLIFLTHVGEPGGAEYAMLDLCKKTTHTAQFLSFSPGSLHEIAQERGIAGHSLAMPDALNRFKRKSSFLSIIRLLPALVGTIRQLIKSLQPYDVQICMSQKSFMLAALAKPFTKKPIIWFMNDLVSKEHFSRTSIFLMRLMASLFADKVILNSQSSLTAWQRIHQKTTSDVIYPGIDSDGILQGLAEQQATIEEYRHTFCQTAPYSVCIIGRICHWKGQDLLLKAASQIPQINVVIVGEALFDEAEFKNSLYTFIDEHQMSERVFFLGHVDQPTLVAAACDLTVHSSTAPEPFGRVIAEAMLTAKPVIASNAGGATEIIEHEKSGYLSPLNESAALTLFINKVLENPTQSQCIGEAGKKRSQALFSIDVSIKKFDAHVFDTFHTYNG